jgi:HSP20 family protein
MQKRFARTRHLVVSVEGRIVLAFFRPPIGPNQTKRIMNTLAKLNPFRKPAAVWDPWRDLETLENQLATAFGRLPARTNGDREENMTAAEWAPLVDITEDDKEYIVKAELPELKKEDVKVTVEAGVLSISGERKFEKEEKGKKYHRIERAYGSFERSFTLPEGTDGSKVNAEFKDGLLTVRLPKTEKAKPKTVEVKVA